MAAPKNPRPALLPQNLRLKKLTLEQIEQIDRFLASIGEYGEVQLIVQRGELKYINKLESHKVGNQEDDD